MYYVYVIQNERHDLYIGYTHNLKRRLFEHNNDKSKSTKGHKWVLIYYESYKSNIDAQDREKALKYRGQAKAQLKRRIKNSRLD